jgi:hypothetical protein
LVFSVVFAQAGAEHRAGSLDVILLFDKSLSMASCINEAKDYAAGSVLGPILVAGDRLIIEEVYGRVDRLISIDIKSEADKAKAIRALRSIKANGRYTDLGAALDAAKKDLDELGQANRPKYVLLITDEKQEAPKGSPYQAPDHKLKHPSLEYIKRVDLGKFRAITVGLLVGAKVEKTAPQVMELLMDPPPRAEILTGTVSETGASPQKGGAAAPGGATASERALPSWLFFGAGALFILALAGLTIVLVISRRKEKEKIPE